MSQPPRNFAEWMRSVDRTLTEVKRNSQAAVSSQIKNAVDRIEGDIAAVSDPRTPAAPIELIVQTYVLPDFFGNMIGSISVDFPDVVFATNGTPINIRKYEMWGVRTDTVPDGQELPPRGLVATSEGSSILWENVVPGGTYEIAIRALGEFTVRPGVFSSVREVTVAKDTVPPPIPSKLTLTQKLSVVTANWDGLPANLGDVMPQDFNYTEYRLRLPDGTFIEPGDQLFKAGSFYDANAPYNVTVYYSHRAVDTSGNKSGWSIEAAISVTSLVDEDSIREALDAASTRIDAVSLELTTVGNELNGRLDTAETDIAASKTRLTTAEGTITNLNTVKLPALQAEIDAAEGRLNTLDTTTLPGLTSSLNDARTRLATAETTLAPLPGKLATAEGTLNTLKNTTIPKLQSDLDIAEATLAPLPGKVSTAEASITAAKGRLDTLDSTTIPALSDRITVEKGRLDTLTTTTLPALQGEMDTAQTELATAFGELDTVDSRVATAKQSAIDSAAATAQAKADAAEQAAIDAAALVAQAKVDTAKAATLTAAATTAQQKADQAEADAVAAAKTATDLAAAGAKQEAIDAAALVAQQKADAAKTAAISAAATAADSKVATAKAATLTEAAATAQTKATQALTDAKADATTKANKALADAKLDATAKADAAKAAAITAAAADATAKAEAAEAAAATTAAADAQTKADAAQAAALAAAKTYADTEASGAGADALAAAKLDATTKADAAKAAAIAAAALDATAKKEQAEANAAADAKTKADAALAAAKLDATSKANAAETAAKTAAAADAKAKADAVKVIADAAIADAAKVRAEALSRGSDLVTNGSGTMGSNTNFSSLIFQQGDQPAGTGGAFYMTAQNAGGFSDQLIPIDTTKKYLASIWAKQANPGVQAKFYLALDVHDVEGLAISTQHYMEQANTRTTLAAALKPGDTTVQLTSGANWKNNAGASSHLRNIIIWNYVDGFGKLWEPGTYSRNVIFNGYDDGKISGNVITLRAPYSGALVPAGTAVGNGSAGGTYLYPIANALDTQGWVKYVSPILFTGVHTVLHLSASNNFPAPTAYVKIGVLTNREAVGGTSKQLFTGISFSDVTANALLVEAADAKAVAAQGAAEDAADAAAQALIDAKADATAKANQALADAKADATAKANAAELAAKNASALVAQAKADTAKSEAIAAAATTAQTKADTAKAEAIAAAKTATDLAASGAKQEAIAAAALTAQQKADVAKQAAIDAAAITAQAKADAAKAAAIVEAANDATAKANAAQAAAISAAASDATTKAGQAQTAAIAAATTMTNGIGSNLSSTSAPTTSNLAPKGSVWRRTAANGTIIGVWEQTGTGIAGTWTPRLITSDVVDNLDVGKLSASTAVINSAVLSKISVGVATIIQLNASAITAGTIDTARLNVTTLAASLATVITLNADRINAGQLDTARINVTTLSAAVADVIQLNASAITAGTIDTARLNVTTLSASLATVIKLNASAINAGTMDTARLNATTIASAVATIIQLNASAITAGTIDTARLNVTTLSASLATVLSLNADRITSGTINAARLDVVDLSARVATVINLSASRITSGTIDTARLNATTIAAATASIQTVDVKNLFAGTGTFQTAVIDKLWADVITARTINASQVNIGQGENLLPWNVNRADPYVDYSNFSAYLSSTQFVRAIGGGVAEGDHIYLDAAWVTPGTSTNTWVINRGVATESMKNRAFIMEPGKEYSASVYLKAGGAYGTTPSVAVGMYFYLADGSYRSAVVSPLVPLTWSWAKHEVSAVAPANTVYALIYIRQNHPGIVRLDMPGFFLKKDASLIVDGGIEARHITASESLTAKVASFLSITAGMIASNAITADKIAAGAITAVKIAANSITADRIAANAITASELATDSVLAINIKAGQITTVKIAAGAVTATEIAANSVTAQHMVIGTGSNIIPNSQLTSIAGWPGWGRNPTNGPAGQPSIWSLGNTSKFSDAFPVEGGVRYRFSVSILATYANTRAYIRLVVGGSEVAMGLENISTGTSWATYTGEVTIPAGGTTATIRVYTNHPNSTNTTGYQWFTNWSLTSMVDGSLIVNGSIDGKAITGADIRTNANPSTVGGMQLWSGGLRGWDTNGLNTINISSTTGAALITGAFRSGSPTKPRIEIQSTEYAVIPGQAILPSSATIKMFSSLFQGSTVSQRGEIEGSWAFARMTYLGTTPSEVYLGADVANLEGTVVFIDSLQSAASQWSSYLGWNSWADGSSQTPNARFGLKTNTNGTGTFLNYDSMATTTSAGNCYINTSGTFYRSTSKRANKLDIQDFPAEKDDLLLSLSARTWYDRGQSEALADHLERLDRGVDVEDENLHSLRRVPGMVAEEVEEAGLTEFVEYGVDGEVEGLMYERLGVALIPVVGRLRDRVVELENEKDELADLLAALTSRVESLENA